MLIVSSKNIVSYNVKLHWTQNLYPDIFFDAISFFSFFLFLLFRFVEYTIRDAWNEMSFHIVCNFDRFFFCISTFTLCLSFICSCSTRSSPQRERERERAQRNTTSWLRKIDNRIAYCTLELSERNTI